MSLGGKNSEDSDVETDRQSGCESPERRTQAIEIRRSELLGGGTYALLPASHLSFVQNYTDSGMQPYILEATLDDAVVEMVTYASIPSLKGYFLIENFQTIGNHKENIFEHMKRDDFKAAKAKSKKERKVSIVLLAFSCQGIIQDKLTAAGFKEAETSFKESVKHVLDSKTDRAFGAMTNALMRKDL